MANDSANLERAADALYGAAFGAFSEQRKQLAGELRRAGNKAAAAAVLKLPRPTLSAFIVNRLWREARPDLEALFEAAARIRSGEFGAVSAQRAALARLRARAADVLRSEGRAASETLLSRTATTLQALAAAGSFEPDPAGRLLADRDPPGFEAVAGMPAAPLPADPQRQSADTSARAAHTLADPQRAADERTRAAQRAQRLAELAAQEATARDAQRARELSATRVVELRAMHSRAQAALAEARARLEAAAATADVARAQLDQAETALAQAQERTAAAAETVERARARISDEDAANEPIPGQLVPGDVPRPVRSPSRDGPGTPHSPPGEG